MKIYLLSVLSAYTYSHKKEVLVSCAVLHIVVTNTYNTWTKSFGVKVPDTLTSQRPVSYPTVFPLQPQLLSAQVCHLPPHPRLLWSSHRCSHFKTLCVPTLKNNKSNRPADG